MLTVGLTMDFIPTDAQRVRFLLGSPPEITRSALAESPTAYRDVLRASAAFLREVYDARWIRGHKHKCASALWCGSSSRLGLWSGLCAWGLKGFYV